MQAAYFLHGDIHVSQLVDPVPGKGQVLVKTLSCGVCASDAHWYKQSERVVRTSKETGGYVSLDLDRPIVFGHEYVAEVIDYGPDCERRVARGKRVVGLPAVMEGDQVNIVGLSNKYPGGFGEYMVLDERFLMEVPDALNNELAAITEPLAVGLHHARMGHVQSGDVPLVVGCGAIGLGIIAGLKLKGASPIIACDLSPVRRALALTMGADVVLDPNELTPYGPIPELGMRRANVIYECVGKPGMLDLIMRSVGHGARIVMGGWCLEEDHYLPACGHMKNLSLHFTGGEEQEDLELALQSIDKGLIDVRPWLGESIGLDGVNQAIQTIIDPASPIRTLVEPWRS